ncbi:MAG: VWA domain-containing protein [Deltaproteobacteria bacterium]|nr:VWA domain-containing protein [Deltaproteobacteria bacterium]
MEARLVEFVGSLRRAGVRVSTSESLDAIGGLPLLGDLGDREAVRDSLRALLIKNSGDQPTFDRLFDLFFAARPATAWSGDSRALEETLSSLRDVEGLGDLADRIEQLADPAGLEMRMRRFGDEVSLDRIGNRLQVGYFTRRLLERMGLDPSDPALRGLSAALARAGWRPEDVERLEQVIESFRRGVREVAREHVEWKLEQNTVQKPQGGQDLAERSFFSLSEREIRDMNDIVSELARKLRTVLSMRRRKARRGSLDAQRTFRRNLQYGGVPVELVFKRRRVERPEIVNLCDVSGSVRYIAHFMLQFMYSIQDLFSKVRSFAYVRELTEVTDWFAGRDVREAIGQILTSDQIDYYNNSDFGHVFETFRARHLGEITHRTTVIILGDARSNYHDPRAGALAAIQEKARQVIWLNPENKLTWGFGDSVMNDYQPYCDQVREVRNLNQLVKAVQDLMG